MKPGAKSRSGEMVNRSDRRRIETRARLLMAAYTLIAEIGPESIVIQSLTDRADVAFGSFYNHFKSKDEIVSAVIEAAVEHTADVLDSLHSDKAQLDEILSRILGLFLKKCADDRVWAAFIARTIGTGRYFEWGFGRRLRRDVLAGVQTKAFQVRDVDIAILGVSGLMMAAILDLVGGRPFDEAYASRVVTLALAILGVPTKRIERLVLIELPKMELPIFLQA